MYGGETDLFDVGFLQWFAARQGIPWPAFEVLDTAKIARRVITRDDAPNCKLSSLARSSTPRRRPTTGRCPTRGRPSTCSTG